MITVDRLLDCEAHLAEVQGVIFDLDDTLYSERDYVKSGYAAVAAAFPLVKDMGARLFEAFEKKLPAIDTVLAEEGLLSEKERALSVYRAHKPSICLYPGAFSLLERLRKTKKLAMITDGRPEGQRAKIEALGLSPLFDAIIVTDELGGPSFRKPSEAPFREMQRRLGLPFASLVYIGDNIKKDFIAPEALGMQSIHFKNREGLYF